MRSAGTEENGRVGAAYGAGVIAALTAEAAFIVMVTLVTLLRGMDPWMPSRMAGALILGPGAVQPAGFVAPDVAVGLALHAGMAVVVGLLYAALLPRVGVSPITGGIITGMLLYAFGFWILPLLFPSWLAPFWLPPLEKLLQAIAHIAYGVIFGWAYARLTRGLERSTYRRY